MYAKRRNVAVTRWYCKERSLNDINANIPGPRQDSPCAGISMIHTSSANWPPSRKREEATALENLRKRVEQSKLYKADRIVDSVVSTASSLNYEQSQQLLDNRPKLLKKVRRLKSKSSFHKITCVRLTVASDFAGKFMRFENRNCIIFGNLISLISRGSKCGIALAL